MHGGTLKTRSKKHHYEKTFWESGNV